MAKNKYAKKIDAAQGPIVEHLRGIWGKQAVTITSHVGNGFPDLLISAYCPRLDAITILLVEVKNDAKGKLTESEQRFHDKFDGPLIIAWDAGQIIEWYRGEL